MNTLKSLFTTLAADIRSPPVDREVEAKPEEKRRRIDNLVFFARRHFPNAEVKVLKYIVRFPRGAGPRYEEAQEFIPA